MKSLILSLSLLFATTFQAQAFETIYSSEGWMVVLFEAQDDTLVCAVMSENLTGHVFSISTLPNGLTVAVTLPDQLTADLRARMETTQTSFLFTLSIDNLTPYEGDANLDLTTGYISFPWANSQTLVDFLGEVLYGNRLDMLGRQGDTLTSFNLAGSFSALTQFFVCHDMISHTYSGTDS